MGLLQRLKESIAWLGGALAALTAIGYAAGYYAFHAHLTMLGLGRVVDFKHEEMLLEGARFFFIVTAHLLQMALALGAALAIILVVITLLGEIRPLWRAWRSFVVWQAERRAALGIARPALGATLVLALLVVLLVVHTDRFFYPLLALGRIDSLLFRAPLPAPVACADLVAPAANGLAPDVAAALLTQGGRCADLLLGEFGRLLDGYLALLIAVWLAFSVSFPIRPAVLARVCRLALALYAMVYTLMLPVDFGILVRAPVYPLARVEFKQGPVVRGNLMARGDKQLLLWLPGERRARWYANDAIASVEVTGQSNLFLHPTGDAR